jgi:hypothetical protein
MSEFTNAHETRAVFQRQLLTTVSAIVLLAICGAGAAVAAADGDRPTLWIELGGQLSRLDDSQEVFAPTFKEARPSIFSPWQKFEGLPLYSIDEAGKLSFQPDGSDWVFSASVRYGRSGSDRHVRQQTHPDPYKRYYTYSGVPKTNIRIPKAARFADTNVQNDERHFIVDFQVGKDVGLGMFGDRDGSSVLNFGVRFAQFSTHSNIALKSDPDWHFAFKYAYGLKFPFESYHNNAAEVQAERNSHGIGPSIAWNASAPVMGNTQSGELSFDWGVNGALLFGRQRAKVHHQTTARFHDANFPNFTQPPVTGTPINTNHTRVRTVTVPNVGGVAGASFRIENFKISAGYRADLFFGAMDGGIDAEKKENVGFYGPFASVSVGLGG